MSDAQTNAFPGGGQFAAHPHLYNYLHTLKFKSAGSIEMLDGFGQAFAVLVHGRVTVECLSPSETLLHLADLMEIDPYFKLKRFRGLELAAFAKATQGDVPIEEQDILGWMDPYDVHVHREVGPFLLRQQVIWKISDPDEWPYLLYPERYQFEIDPLARFVARHAVLPFRESEGPSTDENIYYWKQDEQRLSAREVRELGMTINEGEA